MGRAPCCSKVGLNRGAWTAEEDEILCAYIRSHGEGNWRSLPIYAGLRRCGKSCRLRWLNYLRPDIKRGNISEEEEDLIIRLHSLLGNRWSLIAGRIPGRTDNQIKNYWNTHLSKKLLLSQNHSPPPITMCRARKPISSKQTAQTGKLILPSAASEKMEDEANCSKGETKGSVSSWRELLELEGSENEENTVAEEDKMALDLSGLGSSERLKDNWSWTENEFEGVIRMEDLFGETRSHMLWEDYCNDLTI